MKKLIVSALATIGLFTFIASAALPPEPEQKDFTPEFVQRCKERAVKGEAEGQALYGRALSNGWGVEKDEKSAIEWLTKAAESGNAMGQCTLGVCYKNGQGVEKDETKAAEWFTRAAEQGLPRAQCSLGVCYINGQGVAKDETKAAEWYTKAAEQGDADAQFFLGWCYEDGRGVAKDERKAAEWYTKAAEQGDADAQFLLGWRYEDGRGVAKDETKAAEWYTKAAEQGDADAQCNLGLCYALGRGVENDETKAAEWYTKAAEQGLPEAQCNLGLCYALGRGVEKDETKAAEWYTRAAEQGNAPAQYNLGWCYENGRGVEKDGQKAVEWYTKAAEQGNMSAKVKLQQKWQIDEAELKKSEAQEEEADATPSKPKVGIGPKIKGMQIGMDIDEALRKYGALRGKYFRTPEDTYAFQAPLGDPDSLFDLNKDAVMRFRGLDGNGNDGVTRILFTKEDFNAGSLSDDDFVQKFIDAYGIPKMTHREISGKEFCDLLGTVKIGGLYGVGGNGERVSVDFNTKGCRCHSYRFDCGVEVSAIYYERQYYICVRKVVADSGLKFD